MTEIFFYIFSQKLNNFALKQFSVNSFPQKGINTRFYAYLRTEHGMQYCSQSQKTQKSTILG